MGGIKAAFSWGMIIILLLFGIYIFQAAKCRESGLKSNVNTKWSFANSCQAEINGRWVPQDS